MLWTGDQGIEPWFTRKPENKGDRLGRKCRVRGEWAQDEVLQPSQLKSLTGRTEQRRLRTGQMGIRRVWSLKTKKIRVLQEGGRSQLTAVAFCWESGQRKGGVRVFLGWQRSQVTLTNAAVVEGEGWGRNRGGRETQTGGSWRMTEKRGNVWQGV